MNAHLIEPDKVSSVSVLKLPLDGDGLEKYKVNIENDKSFIVGYSKILLASSEHHNGYLSNQENREYSAIRARRLRTGKTESGSLEKILIGWEDWEKIKPHKVGPNDIHFDEAERIIGRLLYRVAKQPYNTAEKSFNQWNLRASLDFDGFDWVIKHLQDQGYIAFYKYPTGQETTDRWIVTREGFREFENQVRQENTPVLFNVNRYFQRVPIRAKKPFVFVIMPFREELTSIFTEIIQPTVEEVMTGYNCIRADGDPEPGKIDNKVWTLIQEAEFIIAEITDHNPNVLTELGIALTFGKPVYVFSNKPLDTTLFIDVKTLLAQEYSNADDLKKKLVAVLPKK